MNNVSGHLSAQKNPRPPKFWLIAAAAAALLILLLVAAPLLVFFLSIVALVVALLAVAIGRLRWARIPNRRFAGGVAGGSLVLFVASAAVFGQGLPADTAEPPPVAGIAAPAAAQEPDLAGFVGQTCEADHLVMTQGSDSNYCDKDTSGALIWVDQANHDRAIAQAQEQAEKKAAQDKAATEAKAKAKKAEEQAAAKKVAEEKSAAEAKAKAKKAAERKAAAAKAERAAAAAEAKKEAQRQAEKKTAVKSTPRPSAYYANCTAVRAAGAAPIYSDDPGYSRKLDRDGDGVACE
ncbi:excalibur calcium-binding domain-containing protein [Paeniglutamicibacter sp. NPDC012692]|uniref:excalibur calcium-binding domain-containing protein n=1 Tax=Paeniglutamicibacter sp. NPDC012692 TaxID=3364388 RepID=UPI0036745A49